MIVDWLIMTTPRPHARPPPAANEPEGNTPNSGVHERVPAQWAWHHRTLLHLRERLVRAHADPVTPALAPADMLGGDVAESAQEQSGRDALWAALGNEADRLFEVDCALQRIHDGTYGLCEATGHPLPPERLRVIPWARYSFAAAQPTGQRLSDAKKHAC